MIIVGYGDRKVLLESDIMKNTSPSQNLVLNLMDLFIWHRAFTHAFNYVDMPYMLVLVQAY